MKKFCVWLAAALVFSLASAPALFAQEDGDPEHAQAEIQAVGGDHYRGYCYVAGVKGSYAAEFAHGDIYHFGGGGGFLEVCAIRNWLDVEFSLRALSDGHVATMPIDLLFKLPFHATRDIHPYIGIGPALIPVFVETSASVKGGGQLVGGSYFWLWPGGGLLLELSYAALYDGHNVMHEVGVNSGVAFRW